MENVYYVISVVFSIVGYRSYAFYAFIYLRSCLSMSYSSEDNNLEVRDAILPENVMAVPCWRVVSLSNICLGRSPRLD